MVSFNPHIGFIRLDQLGKIEAQRGQVTTQGLTLVCVELYSKPDSLPRQSLSSNHDLELPHIWSPALPTVGTLRSCKVLQLTRGHTTDHWPLCHVEKCILVNGLLTQLGNNAQHLYSCL